MTDQPRNFVGEAPRFLAHATIEGDTGRIGTVRCTLDSGHYPDTSHEYVIAWRDDDTGEETEPYDPAEGFDVEVPMPKRKPFTFRPESIDEVAADRLGDDAA